MAQMKKKLVCMVVLSLWTTVATAQHPYEQSVVSPLQESVTHELQTSQLAQQWGLTGTEWDQYQALMKGARGIMSPGLDPLTTLGIESDSPSERRRLAELWVKHEYGRVEKELAFQREINSAWLRLYPQTLAVNMASNVEGNSLKTRGRLALFVREDCTRCDARLAAMLAENQPVDIYLVGSENDNTIRSWARRHNIPIEKVHNRQITLNQDRGLWLRYGQGKMPVILLQGANGWQLAEY